MYIEGTVNTGDVDVAWSDVGSWDTDDPEYAPDGKDVSEIVCWIDLVNPNLLHVEVTNAYPCIDYWNVVDIHCVGSIPVKLYDVVVSNPNSDVVEVDISYYADAGCTELVTLPAQLHTCQSVYAKIHVHIMQEAEQNETYTFDATIDAVQWNLAP